MRSPKRERGRGPLPARPAGERVLRLEGGPRGACERFCSPLPLLAVELVHLPDEPAGVPKERFRPVLAVELVHLPDEPAGVPGAPSLALRAATPPPSERTSCACPLPPSSPSVSPRRPPPPRTRRTGKTSGP